ncbi:hypothetical protein [Nocardia sp. NPDC051570]|uniref:hypothetical protein n=1 Tax=Nocardia sp. NPDC051570 TaxID=3364324 RepID=UPI00378A54D1
MNTRYTVVRTVSGVADIRHTVADYRTATATVAGLRGFDMANYGTRPGHIGYAIAPTVRS